jgi:3-hydroxyisobutyrate dehydrogenase-like beta-hydroxyacid dehydrogenase
MASPETQRGLVVGFIGIGDQGGPMAARIGAAGFDLTVWARRDTSYEKLGDAPHHRAASAGAVAAGADVVCLCVRSDEDVDEIGDLVLAVMAPGSVLLVHSTVRPSTVERLATRSSAIGAGAVTVLDAPVSGGGYAAAAGTLLTMVGGDADALERVRPVLSCHSDRIVHLGPLGSGLVAKAINNGVFTAQVGLAASALAAGERLGLDPDRLAEVLRGSSARSMALEMVTGLPDRATLAERVAGLLTKDVDILASLGGGDADIAEIVRSARHFLDPQT